MDRDTYYLRFDGAITINPGGRATCGYLVYLNDDLVQHGGACLGEGEGMTSNLAEAEGLLRGLRDVIACKKSNPKTRDYPVIIQGDSLITIRGVKRGSSKYPHLDFRFREGNELMKRAGNCTIEHIPREQNEDADRMASQFLRV